MPGFLRDCCVAIRRYLNEREEYNKTKINKVEVEEMELDQTITKNEPTQVSNVENLNLKEYLHLKLRLLQNLQQLTTIDEQKCVLSRPIFVFFAVPERSWRIDGYGDRSDFSCSIRFWIRQFKILTKMCFTNNFSMFFSIFFRQPSIVLAVYVGQINWVGGLRGA